MCGIAACVAPNHKQEIKELVHNLYHRGPDDSGFFCDEELLLSIGMRRLSIQDLNGGSQPIFSQCRKYLIFFNGEIFNANSLRNELKDYGYKFFTHHSDTEVIIAGFSLFGNSFLEKLNGMFAVIIYNIEKKELSLIRDPIGIKPLYYKICGNNLAISSEINYLQKIFMPSEASDLSSVYFLSFGHIPQGKTIYKDIKQVMPGTCMTIDIKDQKFNFSEKKYWSPYSIRNVEKLDQEKIYETIDSAVKRWTNSDVPISLSLSGGTDSSIILHHLVKNNINTKCYTVNFGSDKNSPERKNLKKLSRQYSLDIEEISYKDIDIVNDLDTIIESLGEPYSGSLASWLIYKCAKGEKVMLSGTGGDELFGNYGKWRNFNIMRKKIRIFSNNFLKTNILDFIDNKNAFFYYPKFFELYQLNQLLNKNKNIKNAWSILSDSIASERKLSRPSLYDLWGQLSSEFLFMSDRFSMNHSIELRTPFLDKDLIEYIIATPYKERSYFSHPKQILINNYKEYIPSLQSLDFKEGFNHSNQIIFGSLKENFLDTTANNSLSRNSILYKSPLLKKIRDSFINEGQILSSNIIDKAWILFMFLSWENKFIK